MTNNSTQLKLKILMLALPFLLFGAGAVFAQRQPAAAKSGFALWQVAAKADASKYAGTESCLAGDCHTSRALQMAKTVHTRMDISGVSVHANCESCHGPGKEHTDRETEADRTKKKDPEATKLIFGFNVSPEANSAPCLACHRSGKGQDLYSRSEHKLQAVGCNECHEPHLVAKDEERRRANPGLPEARFVSMPKLQEETRWLNESLLRKTQQELCVSCHRSVEAQFSLPNRHRVIEGAMKCTDCHDTHGSLTKPLLQKSTAYDTCVSCHSDKRGPYVYEHASVKVEGCTVCHTPHGSVTQHLLVRGEARFLCVSCHGGHGNLGFQASGQCTRCHVAIHGSNASQFYVK